ncbi:MAG: dihydroxyacetone kinase subunit DhaK [Ruminococcaceae bacterium]|nr:dihydroxyacetone kinase subunit DhaK [Oscillospiraceae bacterium]
MKKLINDPEQVVNETLEGFLAAYGDRIARVGDTGGLVLREKKDKVALVIGGGSGHEPMFSMFVGDGLADASISGHIFTSPDPYSIIETATAADAGRGVLFVYGNYAGDNLNFEMASEMLTMSGTPNRIVRVWDDVASAPKERTEDRRGIAGDLFVVKVAGAATAAGLDLDEAVRVTEKARDNTFSIGVALSGGTIPGAAAPAFTLPEDEIEFGLGIHGEPGIRRAKLLPADEIVEELFSLILADSGIKAGDRVCTLVNGLGSTTLSELYIMNRKLRQLLDGAGIAVHDMVVGSFVTCQEMAGASVTLMRLDEELMGYYDAPADSPYYRK